MAQFKKAVERTCNYKSHVLKFDLACTCGKEGPTGVMATRYDSQAMCKCGLKRFATNLEKR